jgi:hypothetical protein
MSQRIKEEQWKKLRRKKSCRKTETEEVAWLPERPLKRETSWED